MTSIPPIMPPAIGQVRGLSCGESGVSPSSDATAGPAVLPDSTSPAAFSPDEEVVRLTVIREIAVFPVASITDTEIVRGHILNEETEPFWIERTALKKIGKVEDQANVALFLASHLSDHITGEGIIVSAGEVMRQ